LAFAEDSILVQRKPVPLPIKDPPTKNQDFAISDVSSGSSSKNTTSWRRSTDIWREKQVDKKLPATTEQTILLALMSTSSVLTMKISPSLDKYPTLCGPKSLGPS
jgi:hypothetical protein